MRKNRVPLLLGLLLALAAGFGHAHQTDEPASSLRHVEALVANGKLEHARRILARLRTELPQDPEVIRISALIEALYAKEWGARADGSVPAPLPAPVAAPASVAKSHPEPGHAFTIADLGLTLLWVPPGSFTISTAGGNDDETPVEITRGYWLGRTEVTQAQWSAMRTDQTAPSLFKGSQRPVESITWLEAMEFVRLLNARERAAGRLPEGYAYTLPTDAEWEHAARAGTRPVPNSELARVAWFEVNSGGQTRPVAQLEPNAWGFYDMQGNVFEWCLDNPALLPGRPVKDPLVFSPGPATASSHPVRGGGWNSSAGQSSFTSRYWRFLNTTASNTGFRLALTPVRADAARAEASSTH